MEHITLGKFSEKHINTLLQESPAISDFSARIEFLSKQFVDIPYKEATLIGDLNTDEVFVVNLEGIDCFTFIDYVEALRVSKSFSEFKGNLAKVRYQSGEIAFKKRNHFFTDWKEFNSELIEDVTEDIAEGKSKRITKNLNEKDDESHFLPGVPCREREIAYIPSSVIDERISGKLQTGDYAGIYSEKKGLDVSHVGILIRTNESLCIKSNIEPSFPQSLVGNPVFLMSPGCPTTNFGHDKNKKGTLHTDSNDAVFIRHASSRYGKVVDEDFKKYISDKPGIIVLRPGRF
jgi:hypothetical protein